jgi:hypothetical protein
MTLFPTEIPQGAAAVRKALYQGTVFRLPPTLASQRLVAGACTRLEQELGESPRLAQFRLSPEEFFQRCGRLRKAIYTEPAFLEQVREVVISCGFDPEQTAFDGARLRVVPHRGHENPAAAAVYLAHRDTWYANPQAQLTWWVALDDLGAEETFVFYPDYFARAVPNNSHEFDYDQWMRGGSAKKIGWQDATTGLTALYPGLPAGFEPGRVWSFSCRAAEVLLFAGAHFHQTRHNHTGRTRFSLDFRTVDLDDHAAGVGAPNVDNRSTGDALRDFARAGDLK